MDAACLTRRILAADNGGGDIYRQNRGAQKRTVTAAVLPTQLKRLTVIWLREVDSTPVEIDGV